MDPFDAAWQVVKTEEDIEKSFWDWGRNEIKTQEDRMAMAQRIERRRAMKERRRHGLPSQPMSPTEQQRELQGLPQPPAPESEPTPAPENEAKNVEANIPMPESKVDETDESEDVDDTEVHVEEGEAYEPESDHEELPGREVPDVNDLVQTGNDDPMVPLLSLVRNTETGELRSEEISEISLELAESLMRRNLGTLEDDEFWVTEEELAHLRENHSGLFEKSESWSVVENPFANPFYDSSYNKITEAPQRGIVNPVQVAPAEIIKEEKPKDINGFAMNDNDDLSLLPSSVFASNDAPVADNMSLLPAGWKADVE